MQLVIKRQYGCYVYNTFICWNFHDIRHVFKIVIYFGIYERDASGRVFPVFKCFNMGDSAAMTS